MRTSGDCKIGNPQNNLTGDCLIANWTPCTRTTKAHSFLLSAYQLKISWLSKDDNYVLERASTMSYASGVTPTPILSASASACLTWAKPWKSVRISESLWISRQDQIGTQAAGLHPFTVLGFFTAYNLTTTKRHCWEQISQFAAISS